MKNYEKIYNRLIKEIKKEAENIATCNIHEVGNLGLLEKLENDSQVSILNWILTLLPEIEGKDHQYVTMNRTDFDKWKKNINK